MRKQSILALVLHASSLAACGGSDGASEQELDRAREEAAKDARQEEQIRQLRLAERERKAEARRGSKDNGKGSKSQSTPSGGSAPPPSTSTGGSKACGGGVSANSVTTCGFASNVRDAYNSNGPGSVPVFSPATGEEILMNCSGSGPTVCTGGRGAAVYFP